MSGRTILITRDDLGEDVDAAVDEMWARVDRAEEPPEAPPPTGLKGLWGRLVGRQAEPQDAQPSFTALYEAVVAELPCIMNLPEGEGAWTDGPLEGNFHDEHALLSMVSSDHLAFSQLVQIATGMGFAVFDDTFGRLWRPGDPAPPVPRQLTLADLKKTMKARMGEALAPHGYKWRARDGGSFRKKTPEGWTEISFPRLDRYTGFEISVLAMVRLDRIEVCITPFSRIVESGWKDTTTLTTRLGYFSGRFPDDRPFSTVAELEEVIDTLVAEDFPALLEHLETYATAEALYPALADPEPQREDGSGFHVINAYHLALRLLALAKLQDPGAMSEIAERGRQAIEGYTDEDRERYERFVEHLRDAEI